MGNCASPPSRPSDGLSSTAAAVVIHVNGRLQEFKQPIKAGHVIKQNPDCFLCNSESMHVDSVVPQVGEEEVLQQGHIYFFLPRNTYSSRSLSLPDLCALAVKAGAVLTHPPPVARQLSRQRLQIPCAFVSGGAGSRRGLRY